MENPIIQQQAAPEMSREEWRERVEAAKRRAAAQALDRRMHPERYAPPPPEDPEVVATERVLNDDSLQRGDIVSTNKGLFVFQGRMDQPRRREDFVPLPPR